MYYQLDFLCTPGPSIEISEFKQQQYSQMLNYDYLFKVILLGNLSAGKSSIFARLLDNTFSEWSQHRIIQFGHYTCQIEESNVRLQIWDTNGMQGFRALPKNYFKSAKGLILVYDICQRQTFRDLDKWIDQAEMYASQRAIKILVGSKLDRSSEREVSEEEGRAFAKKRQMSYIEASAKENINIEKIFIMLATVLKDQSDNPRQFSPVFEKKIIQPVKFVSTCW